MSFLHGVYGQHSQYTGKKPTNSTGTIPVYIGTAPIQQNNVENAENYDYSGYINKPIIINSLPDAKLKLGTSSDFKTFTLMEAVYAHFLNESNPIAPIIVVNMANPANKKSDDSEETIILSGLAGNKVGYLEDDAAVIETVTLAELTKDTDYKLTYTDGKIKVNITKASFTSDSIIATYKKIDTSDTVITTSVFTDALNAIDICEVMLNKIPTVMCSPYYSKIKSYHDLMIEKATNKIANKWYIDVVSDIKADSTINTMAKAIEQKKTDGYNNIVDKVCFPMVKYNDKIYHLSTMCIVDMQQTDTEAGGVPYISPSNKNIYADATVLEDGTQIYINENTANIANANGLTTVNIVRGNMRLWGSSNANYNYTEADKIDPEHLQDASIRMKHYMLNKLQYDYIDNIDNPMKRRDIDSIIASVQQWLNSLVSEGKLLYATIDFVEDNNSVFDMVSGDFVFDVSTTTTPNAKSITFKTHYTTEGINTLTNAGGDE